ncbi:putative RNA-directed RNA polymerase [Helianthus anomalus]
MAVGQATTTTIVRVTNIPRSATAQDLLTFLETHTGSSTIFACKISSDHKNWKSRGFGRVQFETLEIKSKAISLSKKSALCFKGFNLSLSHSLDEVIIRSVCPQNRVEHRFLRIGLFVDRDCTSILESWSGVKSWVLPERELSFEFWVSCCEEVSDWEVEDDDVFGNCRGYLFGEVF